MVDTADILVEIGTEELPPKALYRLAQAFHHLLADELLPEAGLGAAASRWYCSPRRLAMFIEQAPLKQGDREEERLGPKVEAAFDCHGQPTKAAAGFARSCNVEVEALERRETPRGERLAYRRSIAGRSTREILPELVTAALKRLPIPRQMRWNASEMQFVRPVHWVVLLLGEAVVEADILGVQTGRMTRGHRFHHPEPLEIVMPSAYAAVLREQGQVFVERGETRPLMAEIERGVSLTAAEAGGEAELDRALLEEVSALVEWPVALAGHFEPRFLELPDEVLVATLAGQQRYFPIRDPEGRLLPAFIVVSNIESRSPDTVRRGNERVIAPRLADAMFFWNTDRKTPLAVRRSELDRVIFQEDLGSLGDKTRRVAALAAAVAPPIGVERDSAHRAAELAKCDLVTLMVGEFPELQGAMGAYYARHDGEPAEVATAIREHYLPRFAGDALPATGAGQALAIADRLDTLTGLFATGGRPTGDKDPFALRRAGLGLLRIIIEGGLELDLVDCIRSAAAEFKTAAEEVESLVEDVYRFLMERLRAYYQERGIRGDVIEAVLVKRSCSPLDIDRRVAAVQRFLELPAAASLAATNKRIANILRQAGGAPEQALDRERIREPAERALLDAVLGHEAEVVPLLERGDYQSALTTLAELKAPVDRFFDEVLVMTEDPAERANRLALLARLSTLFLHTADLSHIQTSHG